MKINPINFITFNQTPQYLEGGTSAQNIQNQQFDYSLAEAFSQHSNKYSRNSFVLAEALGRSQVNFTGKKDKKYQRYDRMFIDTVAQNLRLSKEDKARLNDNIDEFLKSNGYKSLEDITGDKNHELQADFISELGDDICQSDFDYNILSDTFQERMYYDGQYNPEADLYEKDYEVVDHILDKYGMDETRKAEIFDVLKMHADWLGGETLFDLFKPENKPSVLMDLVKDQLQLNDDLSIDLLIDFGLMAQKDEKARREGIYPWKMTALMNEQAKDEAIACDIIGEYDLEGDEFYEGDIDDDDEFDDDDVEESKSTMEEIAEQLNRRRDGVCVEQIAYELMEKYNLPLEAYEFIKNTIYGYDTDMFADDN